MECRHQGHGDRGLQGQQEVGGHMWLLNTCVLSSLHHGLPLSGTAGVVSTFLLRLHDDKEFFVWKFCPASGCFNRSRAVSEQRVLGMSTVS